MFTRTARSGVLSAAALFALLPAVAPAIAQQIPAPILLGPAKHVAGITIQAVPTIVVGSPSIPSFLTAFDAINFNEPDSPLSGVVSVYGAFSPSNGVLGSGVALDRFHILTAAHVVDFAGGVTLQGTATGDGIIDALMPFSRIYLNNIAAPEPITIESIVLAPNWHGFANIGAPDAGSNHDDLAILTLKNPLPDSVPVYSLYRTPFDQDSGKVILMTGYGNGGDAVAGITAPATFEIKRYGWNVTALFEADDEGTPKAELFLADFDAPDPLGDPTLTHVGFDGFTSVGNDFEAIIAPGDSGGATFIIDDRNNNGFIESDELILFGLNTFTFDTPDGDWPHFGAGFGGPIVSAYTGFIDSIVPPIPEPGSVALLGLGAALLLKRRRRARHRA